MPDYLHDIGNCKCNICGEDCGGLNCRLCDNALALNLAFYLASWGMYRSSFLKSYNHTVYIGAVKILMEQKYVPLFDPYLWKNNKTVYIDLTADVFVKLWNYYESLTSDLPRHASDTLITKIIFGVYGCMPAYDRHFKKGIASVGCKQNITVQNIKSVLAELVCVADALDPQITAVLMNVRTTWDRCALFTPMKIVDMIFWKIGKDLCP